MRSSARTALGAALATVWLWSLFVPTVDPADSRLVLDLRPPALVLALVAGLALLALTGIRLRQAQRWALALLLVAAAALQLVAALVRGFLDRALDLYFDLPQVPSLFGLFIGSFGPWRGAGLLLIIGIAALATLAAVAWAIFWWERALEPPRIAGWALILTLTTLTLGLVPGPADRPLVAASAIDAAADQAARLYRACLIMAGYDHRYDQALAAPVPTGDLALLRAHDVFLVFVESYGSVVLDEPRYRAELAPALAEFATTAAGAGYGIVSSRLTSPVFGAGSWLAHGTLASGLRLDPFLDRLLESGSRPTLAGYLGASGHRTVAVMPGIKKAWPEGAFWGFEQSYYAKDLGYSGPGFGWFDIPDQYTLARFEAAELKPGHGPLFAEIVLVSSHTPFAPVPPYVADWDDAGPYRSVAAADWKRIYREPDWSHLGAPYRESIAYDLRTLGGWLQRLDGSALVIILGDHQPPGLLPGASAPWTVPIHVLSRDPALLAPFARAGYVRGMLPPADAKVKGMESFLGDFLAFFSSGGAAVRAGS